MGLSGTYTVKFFFEHNLGPFDVKAESLAKNSFSALGAVTPINYRVGDVSFSYAEVNFVFSSSFLLQGETILVRFYRKRS